MKKKLSILILFSMLLTSCNNINPVGNVNDYTLLPYDIVEVATQDTSEDYNNSWFSKLTTAVSSVLDRISTNIASSPSFNNFSSFTNVTNVTVDDEIFNSGSGTNVSGTVVSDVTLYEATEDLKYISGKLAFPYRVTTSLTSTFGWRDYGGIAFHNGIDLVSNVDKTIYASGDGTVVASTFTSNGYGNYVAVKYIVAENSNISTSDQETLLVTTSSDSSLDNIVYENTLTVLYQNNDLRFSSTDIDLGGLAFLSVMTANNIMNSNHLNLLSNATFSNIVYELESGNLVNWYNNLDITYQDIVVDFISIMDMIYTTSTLNQESEVNRLFNLLVEGSKDFSDFSDYYMAFGTGMSLFPISTDNTTSITLEAGTAVFLFYAHLASASVSVGDTVTKDTVIGKEGGTGGNYASHLHLSAYTGSSETGWDYSKIYTNPSSSNYTKAHATVDPLEAIWGVTSTQDASANFDGLVLTLGSGSASGSRESSALGKTQMGSTGMTLYEYNKGIAVTPEEWEANSKK